MAHDEREDPIEITGDAKTNMEIELPYFFQEVSGATARSADTPTPKYKICAQVPEQLQFPLPHLHSLEIPLSIENFRSRLVRVVLQGFTQKGSQTVFEPAGTPWKIKIFFEHF